MRYFVATLKNKFVLAGLIIIVISVVVWLVLYLRDSDKRNSMDALRAIPSDAVFALRINNLSNLNQRCGGDTDLFRQLVADPQTRMVPQLLSFVVDTLAAKSAELRTFATQPLWVSGHVFGKEMMLMFAINLPDNLYVANVKEIVPLLKARGFAYSELPYEDEKIATFKRGEVEVLHATVVRRVLIVSPSRVLVEQAVRQARVNASLADNPAFVSASASAGSRVDLNLYISHGLLPKLMPLCVARTNNKDLKFVEQLGDFTVLDVDLQPDAVQLSGFVFAAQPKASYFSSFARQNAVRHSVMEVLPRSVDALVSVGISDLPDLLADYESFAKAQDFYSRQTERQRQLQKRLGKQPAQLLADLAPAEVAVAHVPGATGAAPGQEWFVLLRSTDAERAQRNLRAQLEQAAKADGKKLQDYVYTESMSNKEPLVLYQNPAPGLIASLLGDIFGQCQDTYVAFVGDYMVWSASREALREFVLTALLKKTFAQAVDLSNHITSESNLLVYVDAAQAKSALMETLQPPLRAALAKSELLTQSAGAGVQLRLDGGKVYMHAFMRVHSTQAAQQATQALQHRCEIKLEAPALRTPWVVRNHRTGESELLLQDQANTLYLIDNKGGLLWKRKIDGPIVGEVQQVDILKNKKLQYVFNTATRIYLIDRLGNNVDKFPLSLPVAASNAMAVFDYDGSRDYRFFVAGTDNKIYAFDNKGKAIVGFAPPVGFASIAQPLQHVRTQGRDYLIVVDSRRVHILDRKGNERVVPKEHVVVAPNSKLVAEYGAGKASGSEFVRFVTTTAESQLTYIYLDGKVEYSPLPNKAGEHHFFDLYNLGNGRSAYSILDGKELRVYEQGQLKFKYGCRRMPQDAPRYYNLGGLGAIYSVYVAEEGKAYLLDANGQVLRNFPVEASVPVLLGRLAGNNAVDAVVCDQSGFATCYKLSR